MSVYFKKLILLGAGLAGEISQLFEKLTSAD